MTRFWAFRRHRNRLISMGRAFGVLLTRVYTWRGRKRPLISLRRALGPNAMPTKKDLEAANKALMDIDWKKLDAMTDDEIDAAAENDPDNPPLTDEELASAWRVTPIAKTAAE